MIRTVQRGRDYSGLHDAFCRCPKCKPRHPSDVTIQPWAWALGLGLLVLALVLTW